MFWRFVVQVDEARLDKLIADMAGKVGICAVGAVRGGGPRRTINHRFVCLCCAKSYFMFSR